MRKTILGVAIAAVAAAAALGGYLVLGHRSDGGQGVAAFREARAFAVSGLLKQVEGPYSLLLGDSQMERLSLPTLCGHPAVNGAIAGTRTAGLRAVAGWIVLPRPPDAIVVTIGTNDLTERQRAGNPEATEHFRTEIRALFAELAPRAHAVVATPIPPFDSSRPGVTRFYDVAAAATYSGIIEQECRRAGCRFVDAFADLRNPAGLARSPDGVHLGLDSHSRDRVAARLEAAACPGVAARTL